MELEAAIFPSKLREAEDTCQLRCNYNDPAKHNLFLKEAEQESVGTRSESKFTSHWQTSASYTVALTHLTASHIHYIDI